MAEDHGFTTGIFDVIGKWGKRKSLFQEGLEEGVVGCKGEVGHVFFYLTPRAPLLKE